MNKDLKIIKAKYGEKMMKLCRELFPTLLEEEGLLSNLLLSKFESNHSLYDDIISNDKDLLFKDYIYSLMAPQKEKIEFSKTPEELLSIAGYNLYECKTEEEVQSFKKYYTEREKLCTFNGGRLNRCFVFFAVKKNVDEIKREDFSIPQREDEYGTSVISIQFSRGSNNTLSIKNRYNHTVANPDATFSNNLDNIIEGLTDSFSKTYGYNLKNNNSGFELPGYVIANNGKYYKYNCELNNVYYCPNNIVIDNFEVSRLDKSEYLVIDNCILDLKNKRIKFNSYFSNYYDSFKIKEIEIKKKNGIKVITITLEFDKKVLIEIDKDNNIIGLEDSNLEIVDTLFMCKNKKLKKLSLPNVTKIESYFLRENEELTELNLPKVREIEYGFLEHNKKISKLILPQVQFINDDFLRANQELTELSLPSLQKVGHSFIRDNEKIKKINLPNLKTVGNSFFYENRELISANLEKLKEVDNYFLMRNNKLRELNLPSLELAGCYFLGDNKKLEYLNAVNLKKVDNCFINCNKALDTLYLPNLEEIGNSFLSNNEKLSSINLDSLKITGSFCLMHNQGLKKLSLPNLVSMKGFFLNDNKDLESLSLPKVKEIGKCCFFLNTGLKELFLPRVRVIGDDFLVTNTELKLLILNNLREVGNLFLFNNKNLKELYLPNLLKIGSKFLEHNTSLATIYLPKLESCGENFLKDNKKIKRNKDIKKYLKKIIK